MSEEKLTYEDVRAYEKLFTMTPSFILSTMIRRNTNLVEKFKSQVVKFIGNLNEKQEKQLDLILNSDIDNLQVLMMEAYKKSKKKQYKLLGNPKNKDFIKMNLDELKKLL